MMKNSFASAGLALFAVFAVTPSPGNVEDSVPEAGSFRMGCVSDQDCADIEKPVHEVVIARPLAIPKYEVTCADYDRCIHPDKVDDKGWGSEPYLGFRLIQDL